MTHDDDKINRRVSKIRTLVSEIPYIGQQCASPLLLHLLVSVFLCSIILPLVRLWLSIRITYKIVWQQLRIRFGQKRLQQQGEVERRSYSRCVLRITSWWHTRRISNGIPNYLRILRIRYGICYLPGQYIAIISYVIIKNSFIINR